MALDPVAVVRGTGFHPREHLLVRLIGRGVSSKHLLADTHGSFRAALRTPPARSCGQYVLMVMRSSPAKPVRVKIGPPECAPLDGGEVPAP